MRYFPTFFDLLDRKVSAVGGDDAAGNELFVLEQQRFPADAVRAIAPTATTAFPSVSRDAIASEILRAAS